MILSIVDKNVQAVIGHIAAGVLFVVHDRFDPRFFLGHRKVVTSIQEPFLKIIELFSLDLRHITATRCCASVVALRELNYS